MALQISANKAKVCFIGLVHDTVTILKNDWEQINRKELRITGGWQGYSAPFPGEEWKLTAHFFKTGQLKVLNEFIYKKYHLSQAKEAFALFENPQKVNGKVLFVNDWGELR